MTTVKRYYEDYNRKLAHESQLEHKHYFTFEQVRDICALLNKGLWPDGHYSDDECNLWEVLADEFDIEVR